MFYTNLIQHEEENQANILHEEEHDRSYEMFGFFAPRWILVHTMMPV